MEWLKSADVYGDLDKVIECMCLEQFFRTIPEPMRLWILDRSEVTTVQKAAELAEEYASRRGLQEENRTRDYRREGDRRGESVGQRQDKAGTKPFFRENRGGKKEDPMNGTSRAPAKTVDEMKEKEKKGF